MDIRACKKPPKTVPKTAKHFSRKQEPPFWGLFSGTLHDFCPFLQYGHTFARMISKYLRPYMLSRKWLQKSSAIYLVPRVFAQKGFAISIFGHFFCPFPENFIESCRVKTKNNNFKL